MMKHKLYIILTLIFTLGLGSCDKSFLETKPSDSIAAADAFATTTSAMAAMNGVYRAMVVRYQSSQGHTGYPHTMIINDVLGEDHLILTTGNTWHVNEARYLSHRSETGTASIFMYELFYRVVSNCNNILAGIDNAVGPASVRNQVKGEALALRAFSYYHLVQYYGKRYDGNAKPNNQLGVPLILEPTIEARARNTVEEVYTQVIKDLNAAALLLTNARNAKSHINLAVVKGLLARTYLTQQDWTNAAKFAAEARTGLSLMSNAQYEDGFQDISNPEWIWGFDHLEDQSEFFGGFHSYMSCNYNSSAIRTCPRGLNKLVYDSIPATDIRAKMWVRTPTTANSITPPGGVRVAFMNQKFRLPGTPSTSLMGDTPYMRVGELFLIEAEAKARLNDNAGAQAALFTLIKNRNASYVLSTRTGAALINEILFHRRVELWGEGFRYFDLKRMNLPLVRATGAQGSGAHIVSVIVETNIAAGDNKWEFLIPRAELNTNSLMVQNPL